MTEKIKPCSVWDMPGNFQGEDGKVYLVRCPSCKRENWAPAVADGVCAWCGWSAESEKGADDED